MRQANFLSSYPVPTVRRGHTDRVTSVSFSPDGQLVASSSGDMLIRIWDARRPSQRSKVFKGHTNTITSVAYSPLGDMLASGSWDQTVRIWDTSTRLEICEPLEGHNNCVTSVDFSPNSKLVASGSDDKTIRLWDVQSGTSISDPFEGHTSWVKSVVFSPDGTRIGSSSNDGTIRIWGTEHGRTVVGPLKGHISCVNSIAFSPDGSQIISGSQDSTLRLWDIRVRGQVGDPYKGHTSWVTSVAFSPDGMHYVASGSRDNTIRVWDTRMGRRVFAPFEEHESSVTSVAISPSGLQLASGSNDWSVMVWHLPVYDSKAESDTQSELEEDTEQSDSDDGDWHLIGQHMVIQDMFELLASHGCVDLTPKMDINQDTAILMSGGGFGDIWRGELLDGTKVAIKAWRDSLVEHCDYKTLKRATREIYYWSKMRHENVHELMGVLLFKGQSLGMVSEWMENGNLHEYLRKNPDTDRYQMSVQVTSGLAYIHSLDMVHGDIKALNVLVSADGVAKITDFGLSTMSESSLDFSATTSPHAGSIRWAAPELLLEETEKSTNSDIYALGMTILEIFTGNVPYSQIRRDYVIIQMVGQGTTPAYPAKEFGDDERGNTMWNLLVGCWDRDPSARPTAHIMVDSLTSISAWNR